MSITKEQEARLATLAGALGGAREDRGVLTGMRAFPTLREEADAEVSAAVVAFAMALHEMVEPEPEYEYGTQCRAGGGTNWDVLDWDEVEDWVRTRPCCRAVRRIPAGKAEVVPPGEEPQG